MNFAPEDPDDYSPINLRYEEILESLDGTVAVKRMTRNNRTERLRSQHAKWEDQMDEVTKSYLFWASSKGTGEISDISGCPADVGAPPISSNLQDIDYYITLAEVLGTHCEYLNHLEVHSHAHSRGSIQHGN